MMLAPMIPENAPFSPEQRAWLSGFFAGLFSLDGAAAAPALIAASVPDNGESFPPNAEPLADGDDDEAPWHDPTIPLAERMKLAAARPLRRRLMAAMAQQDCGQCGYNCEEYANALFCGEEKRLNLCVPGGKETQRMLKALYAEKDDDAAGKPATTVAATVPMGTMALPATTRGYARETPVMVSFRSATLLNKEGSEKETRHIEFDIADSGLEYSVGDSLGVFVSNPPQLVDAVIEVLGASADAEVGDGTGVAPFRAFLQERRAIGATGKAWLFFGHQRRAYDFFYEDEFSAMLASGKLTRLSLAFSRDQAEKIYVQDRMREEGGELYRWLDAGAHLFVCGDAKRMAPDVERALIDVVAQHGGKSEAEAKAYVAALAKAGHYRKDVY